MNLEDKWLVWRFNRGDCAAVEGIYEKYKSDLLALALALLRERAMAEDVVHEVFAAFLKLERFRLTGSLKAYLCTCVANAARNILRAQGRHPQEPVEQAELIEAPTAGPDTEAMRSEEDRLVSDALSELPFAQREVVVLHLRGGLRFAQIAKSQQVSVNTVLGRYRYGLEKIRSRLNGEVSKCGRMTLSRS